MGVGISGGMVVVDVGKVREIERGLEVIGGLAISGVVVTVGARVLTVGNGEERGTWGTRASTW